MRRTRCPKPGGFRRMVHGRDCRTRQPEEGAGVALSANGSARGRRYDRRGVGRANTLISGTISDAMLAMRTTVAKVVFSGIPDAVTYDAQRCIDSSSTGTATSTWSCCALSVTCPSQTARLSLCKIAGTRRLSVLVSCFGATGLDITSRAAATAEMPIGLYSWAWRSGGRPKDCGSTNSVAMKSDMMVLCYCRRRKTNELPVWLPDS